MIRHPQRRRHRPWAITASVTGLLALTSLGPGASPANAVVVQDQENTGPIVGDVASNFERERGQTFVAGVTGPLVRISISGCDSLDNTTSMTIRLYPASGAASSSTPDTSGGALAQQTLTGSALAVLPPSSSCGTGEMFTVVFDSPATVTAGSSYVFTVEATQRTSTSAQGVLLDSTLQGDYPQGNRSTRVIPGSTWVADTTRNLRFITYVDDGRTLGAGMPDVLEMFGLPTSSSCSDVPESLTTNVADRTTGWSQSWTDGAWLNEGHGGPVCVRILRFMPQTGAFAPVI